MMSTKILSYIIMKQNNRKYEQAKDEEQLLCLSLAFFLQNT